MDDNEQAASDPGGAGRRMITDPISPSV